MTEKIALYNDSFQNWKTHDIQKAQLILSDLPYQIGENAYGSSPAWYIRGERKNGESAKAMRELLLYKNQKYGDSALHPKQIFIKAAQ